MIRIQTTYNYGCEQVEKLVEINDLGALTVLERAQIFELATRTIDLNEADEEININTSELN